MKPIFSLLALLVLFVPAEGRAQSKLPTGEWFAISEAALYMFIPQAPDELDGHIGFVCIPDGQGRLDVLQINVGRGRKQPTPFDAFATSLPARVRVNSRGKVREFRFAVINERRARTAFAAGGKSMDEWSAIFHDLGQEIQDGGSEIAVEVAGQVFRAPLQGLDAALKEMGCTFPER